MSVTSQKWIIALLLINITLTLAVLMRQQPGESAAQEGTPLSLSEELVVPFARRVVDAYNSGNADRLYALYHEDARERLTRGQVAEQLTQLHGIFGTVAKVSYLNNIRLGEKGGQSYYQAHFSVKVNKPSLEKAQLQLHLIQENGTPALYGMRLNAGAN